jgi:hypothetical protein
MGADHGITRGLWRKNHNPFRKLQSFMGVVACESGTHLARMAEAVQ